MRLIDADDLIEIIKNIQEHMREANENPVPVDAREIWTLFIDMVEKQSTAYDVKSVVKELKTLKMQYYLTIANTGDEKLDFAYKEVGNAIDKAIEIVRNGGVSGDS